MLVERAQLLDDLALRDDAIRAYAAALSRDPSHFAAMMRFGALLVTSGQAGAARTVFCEAVRRHPTSALAHACLANLLVDAGETDVARATYERAIELDPAQYEAHRGLAILAERAGDYAVAETAWRRGFPDGSIVVAPYRGATAPVRVLFVTSAVGGNVPMQHILDDRIFEVATLIAESWTPGMQLPPHDVVFNAIGDGDRCARPLAFAERAVSDVASRIVNPPARIRTTTRVENARRLHVLDADVVVPHVTAFSRDALNAAALEADGFSWPLLLRSPGFHTGEHFVRVERRDDLPGAVEALPGSTLLAMTYVDTRGADGGFRKYRVMTIGGALYPLHLAVAPDWKVHYFTAPMAEREDWRAQEARFLDDMEAALGSRAVTALTQVAGTIGLDYGGIDFAFDAQGRVVVFEANATMAILPPNGDPLWNYRRPAARQAIEATQRLLTQA